MLHTPTKQNGLPERPEYWNCEIPGVLDFVLKDLSSQDPHTRLRALDYWTATGTPASLMPLFEALEDQDQAVRTRVTAIVEQQWAIEEFVLDLRFFRTRSGSGEQVTTIPDTHCWTVIAEQNVSCRGQ